MPAADRDIGTNPSAGSENPEPATHASCTRQIACLRTRETDRLGRCAEVRRASLRPPYERHRADRSARPIGSASRWYPSELGQQFGDPASQADCSLGPQTWRFHTPHVRYCKGLRMPAMTTTPHVPTAGVGKASMQEVAEGEAPSVQWALWRFSLARRRDGWSWLQPTA